MATTIYYQGTREDLFRFLRSLPRIFAGHAPDPADIARGVQTRMGVALMSRVQKDFITKSRGGTGEDGIKWKPLDPATIANRRPAPRKRKGERPRGLLSADQDRQWRGIFASAKSHLQAKFGFPPAMAAEQAAKTAWAIVKAAGGKTKLAVYGGREVDILTDTGELRRSFSPGTEDNPAGVEGQVFQVLPGRVIVGTNKKPWHHKTRPFWPPNGQLPPAWWSAILNAGLRGMVRAMTIVLGRAA